MKAAGWQVVWAGNHWAEAVAAHKSNHPEVIHSCQDLQQADFTQVPDHDVLWASPSCKGHSTAASRGGGGLRGMAPGHDYLRSTAWAAITAAECKRPSVVVIENVTQMRRWVLYRPWLAAWKALGYAISENVINAADLGVPQNRERLFLVGVLGSTPLNLTIPRLPEDERPGARGAVELRRGRWRRPEDCPAGIRRRIARGVSRGHTGAFLTQSVTGHAGRSLDRPSPTVTTRHQMGLVRGRGRASSRQYRPLMLEEYLRLTGFPAGYEFGVGIRKAVIMLGNAVAPPVATWIAQQIENRVQ